MERDPAVVLDWLGEMMADICRDPRYGADEEMVDADTELRRIRALRGEWDA